MLAEYAPQFAPLPTAPLPHCPLPATHSWLWPHLRASSAQECAHVIDAACLAGQDVRRLAFAERRRRAALLLQGLEADPECLKQQGRGGVRRLPVRQPARPWLVTPTPFLTLSLALILTLP